jgi:hypothetical protein
MIDLQNNSTTDTFLTKKEDIAIATDTKECKDMAIGDPI